MYTKVNSLKYTSRPHVSPRTLGKVGKFIASASAHQLQSFNLKNSIVNSIETPLKNRRPL